jgi:hypothetical protein
MKCLVVQGLDLGSQVTDPGIARDSIFAQPGAEGTFTYSDMGDDIINLSPGSITPWPNCIRDRGSESSSLRSNCKTNCTRSYGKCS